MSHSLSHIGLLSVLLLGLAACSTVGEKDFACPGRPPGVRCMSATEVYGATHDTDQVAATSKKALGDDPRRSPPRAKKYMPTPGHPAHKQPARQGVPSPEEARVDSSLLRTQVLAPMVDKPIPIRTPAQVMRAWLAPWEDARGVLHAGGYAFIEVESRRWTFGETQTTAEPVRFFSIQPSAAESKEIVGKDRSVPTARTGTSERSERPNSSTLSKKGASK